MDIDLASPGFERIAGTDAPLDQIAHGLYFGEGPVWDRRKKRFLWTDIIGDTIYEWSSGVGRKALIHPSSHANGMTFDREGRLRRRRLVAAHDLARRARRLAHHHRVALPGQEIQQPERHRRALGRLGVLDRFRPAAW